MYILRLMGSEFPINVYPQVDEQFTYTCQVGRFSVVFRSKGVSFLSCLKIVLPSFFYVGMCFYLIV
jgi:hypothetical protein